MLIPVLKMSTINSEDNYPIQVGEIIFMKPDDIIPQMKKNKVLLQPLQMPKKDIEHFIDDKIRESIYKYIMNKDSFNYPEDETIENEIDYLGFNNQYSFNTYNGGLDEKIVRTYKLEEMVNNYVEKNKKHKKLIK